MYTYIQTRTYAIVADSYADAVGTTSGNERDGTHGWYDML